MSWAIIGLMAGFILVLAALTLLVLKTRLALPFKFLVVILVTAFYWVQYTSLKQYAGWPVTGRLPAEFVLLAAEIVEPNKQTGDKGVMYWWVRESDDPGRPPRVYQLPYVTEVHQQAVEVIDEQRQGAQFVGRQSGSPYSGTSLGVTFEKISKSARHQKERGPAAN